MGIVESESEYRFVGDHRVPHRESRCVEDMIESCREAMVQSEEREKLTPVVANVQDYILLGAWTPVRPLAPLTSLWREKCTSVVVIVVMLSCFVAEW